MESYLLNKQRAATEVIVQEVDGVNAFYIRTNGTEQCLSSVLNLDLERNLDGEIKQRIAMVLKLMDTYELCKGYEPAAGEKMLTSLQHNLFSVCEDTCEVTRAFSTDCQIVHKRNGGGERCGSCKNLSRVDRQRKKRETVNIKCNRRWLEKEDIEKQLDQCRKEKRNAEQREKYWREKFASESICLENEDHVDLKSIFGGIETKDVPYEMKTFWDQQQKILNTASPHGYRWHPKYVFYSFYEML